MIYMKKIMNEVGLSQYRLAKSTSMNQARISLILNDKVKPTDREQKMIEDFFLMPIENLLQEIE